MEDTALDGVHSLMGQNVSIDSLEEINMTLKDIANTLNSFKTSFLQFMDFIAVISSIVVMILVILLIVHSCTRR